MKQQEALIGISKRIIDVEPQEPVSLRFSLLQHGGSAFNLVFNNLNEEFPFLWSGKEEYTDRELEEFDRLFCWFLKRIVYFPNDLEKPEAELAKLLAVAATLDCDDQLWEEVYKSTPNITTWLLTTLVSLIKERHIDSEMILTKRYHSERHVKSIMADIKARNWRSLDWVLGDVWGDYYSRVKFQATAALYRYDKPLLQSLLEEEERFFEIASYTHHAPVERVIQFATASTNWTFKFLAFHRSIRSAMVGEEKYPEEWQTLLSQASEDLAEWSRWMSVVNEHPSRYPQIQDALGVALSRASGEALEIYVKSISMTASDAAKESITVALNAFRQRASLKDRKKLWEVSFHKWREWDFGTTEQSKALFRVSSSVLDYAVIGYLTECLDVIGRKKLMDDLETRAVSLEHAWSPDTSPILTERFKLASIYQLCAHAELVCAGELDWPQGASLLMPPWEDGSRYRSLRYDTEFRKPTFRAP